MKTMFLENKKMTSEDFSRELLSERYDIYNHENKQIGTAPSPWEAYCKYGHEHHHYIRSKNKEIDWLQCSCIPNYLRASDQQYLVGVEYYIWDEYKRYVGCTRSLTDAYEWYGHHDWFTISPRGENMDFIYVQDIPSFLRSKKSN